MYMQSKPLFVKIFFGGKKSFLYVFAFKGSPCYQPCTESLSLHFVISNNVQYGENPQFQQLKTFADKKN